MEKSKLERVDSYLLRKEFAERWEKVATFCMVLGVLAIIGPLGLKGVNEIAPPISYVPHRIFGPHVVPEGSRDCIIGGACLLLLAFLIGVGVRLVRPRPFD